MINLDYAMGEEFQTSQSELERYIGYEACDEDWVVTKQAFLITYKCGGTRVAQYDTDEGYAQLFV